MLFDVRVYTVSIAVRRIEAESQTAAIAMGLSNSCNADEYSVEEVLGASEDIGCDVTSLSSELVEELVNKGFVAPNQNFIPGLHSIEKA